MSVLLIVLFVIDDNFLDVENNVDYNSIYCYKFIILVLL